VDVKITSEGKVYEDVTTLHVFTSEDIDKVFNFQPKFAGRLVELGMAEDVSKPKEIEVPEVNLEVPKVNLEVPEVKLEVPEVKLEVPEVKLEAKTTKKQTKRNKQKEMKIK